MNGHEPFEFLEIKPGVIAKNYLRFFFTSPPEVLDYLFDFPERVIQTFKILNGSTQEVCPPSCSSENIVKLKILFLEEEIELFDRFLLFYF